jgi:putative endonuclease
MRSTWTYILASKPRGTLYIGVTNGLIQRVEQPRAGTGSAFTRRYRVHTLVWYEEFASAREAIQREKSLKHYNRAWKITLIERTNPRWVDLYPLLPGVAPLATLLPRRALDPRPKAEDERSATPVPMSCSGLPALGLVLSIHRPAPNQYQRCPLDWPNTWCNNCRQYLG